MNMAETYQKLVERLAEVQKEHSELLARIDELEIPSKKMGEEMDENGEIFLVEDGFTPDYVVFEDGSKVDYRKMVDILNN